MLWYHVAHQPFCPWFHHDFTFKTMLVVLALFVTGPCEAGLEEATVATVAMVAAGCFCFSWTCWLRFLWRSGPLSSASWSSFSCQQAARHTFAHHGRVQPSSAQVQQSSAQAEGMILNTHLICNCKSMVDCLNIESRARLHSYMSYTAGTSSSVLTFLAPGCWVCTGGWPETMDGLWPGDGNQWVSKLVLFWSLGEHLTKGSTGRLVLLEVCLGSSPANLGASLPYQTESC